MCNDLTADFCVTIQAIRAGLYIRMVSKRKRLLLPENPALCMRFLWSCCFLLVCCHLACRRPAGPEPIMARMPPARPTPPRTIVVLTTPAVPTRLVPVPIPTLPADPGDSSPAPSPKREFRAVWIATVDNIDWPSRKGLPANEQQREFRALLDGYQQARFNAVIVQIRAAADAFYARSAEPWSEWLTGQQGLAPDPLYDPLELMLTESHRRGLEFHAWLNLDRGTFSRRASVAPDHITNRQPDWFLTYGDRQLFNFGLPQVRTYVAGVVANIVRNYDVDGIHFDDYFYPYAIPGQTLHDDTTYLIYATGQPKDDWRRDNIDRVVLEVRDSIRAVKPWVKFGISPFGIWKNQRNDPTGSLTNGGQAYYDLYADTRKWAQQGWVDYMVPQIYFTAEFDKAPYRVLTDWWTRNAGSCHLYIGHGAYRVGKATTREPAWANPAQLPAQIRYNRSLTPAPAPDSAAQTAPFSPIRGSVFFSAKSVLNNPLGLRDSLQTDLYSLPALVPPMPWLDSQAPDQPANLTAIPTPEGIRLNWLTGQNGATTDIRYFVIYRANGHLANLRTDDPRRILAVWQRDGNDGPFIDTTALPGHRYTYAVTAVDRLHNESPATVVITP
jgi:uncharacterized lipoprotein YddW (UPF0748 family)